MKEKVTFGIIGNIITVFFLVVINALIFLVIRLDMKNVIMFSIFLSTFAYVVIGYKMPYISNRILNFTYVIGVFIIGLITWIIGLENGGLYWVFFSLFSLPWTYLFSAQFNLDETMLFPLVFLPSILFFLGMEINLLKRKIKLNETKLEHFTRKIKKWIIPILGVLLISLLLNAFIFVQWKQVNHSFHFSQNNEIFVKESLFYQSVDNLSTNFYMISSILELYNNDFTQIELQIFKNTMEKSITSVFETLNKIEDAAELSTYLQISAFDVYVSLDEIINNILDGEISEKEDILSITRLLKTISEDLENIDYNTRTIIDGDSSYNLIYLIIEENILKIKEQR